jgi:hypothetical protein
MQHEKPLLVKKWPRKSHGTDDFTSPPKEGMMWIFGPKNPTASAGFDTAILSTRGQHANPKTTEAAHTLGVLKGAVIQVLFLLRECG